MPVLEVRPTRAAIEAGEAALAANEYPGRVIVMGVNSLGTKALQAYALMGRSECSRNRIFVEEEGVVRTVAPDKTPEEMAEVENAELIYYTAMQSKADVHVVSNGAQTPYILDDIYRGFTLSGAVAEAPTINGINLSKYEPDGLNFTPRIAGVMDVAGSFEPFALSVTRKNDSLSRQAIRSSYVVGDEPLISGIGFTIQTYKSNGDPLPSFDEKPYPVQVGEGMQETAEMLWDKLNRENRVALVVKEIDLISKVYGGVEPEFHIINAREQ